MKAPVVTSLGSGIAAYSQLPGDWFLNNAGWCVGPNATLLIDTCATEARTRRLLTALGDADSSGRPPTVALTHAHGDHANGAGLVARAGGTVLATSRAAAVITAGPHTYPEVFAYDGWGDITPPLDIRIVDNPIDLDLGGGRSARIIPVPGRAHTDGDLVVWLPHDSVLFTGDLLFAGVTPLAVHGSIAGWLAALGWLATFEAAHIVPGHGPVAGHAHADTSSSPDPLAEITGYLRWLLDVTEAADPDFAGLAEQARTRWPNWLDSERHAANLRIAHAEAHGHVPDLAAIFAAMLASAGGVLTLRI
ncbi:MAG TPA: MBL fold metallo-hydrolase [Pseudonocardiaceae bacterium]|jgi:cyclase|nr:MBL fold metallo-hydrolase [Pseudonocardiaceae bacterium]